VRNPALAQEPVSRNPIAGSGDRQSVAVSLEGTGFEESIEELSASLVRSPVGEIGTEIDLGCEEIVLGLNLDRGALAQIAPKSGKLTVRQSWGRDHLAKLPIGLELAQPAPWFDEMLRKGRTVAFSAVKQHPEEFSLMIGLRSDATSPNQTSPCRLESPGKSLERLGLPP
jgi:hypothetical protein